MATTIHENCACCAFIRCLIEISRPLPFKIYRNVDNKNDCQTTKAEMYKFRVSIKEIAISISRHLKCYEMPNEDSLRFN